MMSAKPASVTRATRPPRRSSSALVATVVPWASSPGGPPAAEPAPVAARTPAATATDGSDGVDGTLAIVPSSATTSVNVPPVSTPTRPVTQSRRRGLDDPDVFFPEMILERPDQL